MNRDNLQFDDKVALRRHVLRQMSAAGTAPVILEAFAGYGKLFAEVYREECLQRGAWGACIEQDKTKAGFLAQQRDGGAQSRAWVVASGTCEKLLGARFCAHIPFTLLDLDPYGSPWLAMQAWMVTTPQRTPVPSLWVAASDGAGFSARLASTDVVLAPHCKRLGETRLRETYGQVAREVLEELALPVKRRVAHWEFFQTPGAARNRLAHWCARLDLV